MANVKESGVLGIKKVLVPIDGSQSSFKTAKYALMLAKAVDASITLLHITREYSEEVRKRTEEWFNMIKNYPEATGININSKVVTAESIGSAIVETASKEGADLIVISPKGISKFAEVELGSITRAVTTNAPCSVLVVK